MSEFRQDITTNDWVLIAETRGRRPSDFKHTRAVPENLPEISDDCPFCEGKANDTPEIIAQYPKAGRWLVRVVPNKFKALEHVSKEEHLCSFYCVQSAHGDHEVIFTYPHNRPLSKQSPEVIDLLLLAFLDRMNELSKHEEVKYIHIIENRGEMAGASLVHPHWQIFTTPFIPPRIQGELTVSRKYYEDFKSCVYCDIMDFERVQNKRVVLDSDEFLVMAPYASKVPYQLRILPKRHAPDFRQISEAERAKFAEVLGEVFSRLSDRLNDPAYNFYLHTLPCPSALRSKTWNYEASYHWHLVVMPRLSRIAGFELGTEVYVNTLPPEEAAKFLR